MRTPARRGAPLWTLLLVLVVLPTLGLGAFTVVLGQRAQQAAEAAVEAETGVRAFGRLAGAAAAVDQELLTLTMTAALGDPTTADRLGLTPLFAHVAADAMADDVAAVRATTDQALDDAERLAQSAGPARAARAEVTRIRAEVDAGRSPSVTDLRDQWVGAADLLRAGQSSVVVGAATAAGSVDTVAAIRDVRVVAELTEALNPDLVDYVAWLLADPADAATQQWVWLGSRAAVLQARQQMTTLTDPTLRAGARALDGTAESRAVDDLLDAVASGSLIRPDRDQWSTLVLSAQVQNQQTLALLDVAVELAAARAQDDGAAAAAERDTTVAVAVAAVLLSLVVLWVVGRHIAGGLRRLAAEADHVSQGRLVEVSVGGPREVRSVGSAFGATVATLRRIQDQAGAVARGDLTDPVLDEPLPGPLGEVVHSSVQQLVTSVRKRERLQDALTHEAAHDPLTDLPNRAQALRLTTAALHRARRAGASTGLLFVDLDGFKGVNDRAGHAAGDAVLRTVGARMREVARAGDTVCRLGGDEFVVLVEAVGEADELVRLGERLVRAASRPVVVATATGPRQVAVGASIGVALAQDGEVDGDELLAQADAAVYRAKHSGRGRVEVFDERLREHLAERRDLEEALRFGLAAGQLHVLYQPVVDVVTGELLGFEALPRWDRPGVGTLTPEDFVPVAEQSDLVCDLDRWVLRAAIGQLARWRADAGLTMGEVGPVVSVNVSARLLGDPRVTDLVLGELIDAGLPARSLVLEVGESAVVESPTLLVRLAALRELGVRVAIDDFGTGTTSIGALRHLPVDTLKVDGSFVSPDPADQRLVALMVAAAHASGLTVVAEGVEHADVLDRLAADACDAAQGHHLSVPLPADRAGALFRTRAGQPIRG